MFSKLSLFVILNVIIYCNTKQLTHQLPNRSTIVHLFEWKWKDVAEECERFLAPKGFGGVQISPPSENLIVHTKNGARTWYERYQVMSYNLTTRSGNEKDFLDMTKRCNRVGVRIYADVVINHMTGDNPNNTGTAGNKADFKKYDYPAVPYHKEHFHYPHCIIENYNDANQVRSCDLVGLKDLNHNSSHVQAKIVNYLNNLIMLGVAGFRVDAAKHMWPNDLKAIYDRLDNLNPEFGFASNLRPYIYQEVIYYGNEAVKPQEYTSLGTVTEFRVGTELKEVFRGRNALKWLVNWGEGWGLLPSDSALAFIDNHDTQRSNDVLTYKESRAYKGAIAFMLAHPYGVSRIMSSYAFDNDQQGPPSKNNEEILSPTMNKNDTCNNGWVCEHRWRQIYQMVGFRNAVKDSGVENWWDNGNNQIAFSRGNKGFIAFNLERNDLNERLYTGLPPGQYCDVITGKRRGKNCTGKLVIVDNGGYSHIFISSSAEDIHFAIHVGLESTIK